MNYIAHDGPNQYGARKGTLGLALHMTEGNGGDGDLAYLLGDPARGVSANFFSHEDGSIHQLMPIGEASGSMNPADRQRLTTGYYGQQNIVAVLGTHWTDPNAWSISIEIGGKRADGPNDRQVAACIAWGRDMRARYPGLVGAYGHADQTDTKGCPGLSPAIQAIFAGIGGHGRFITEEDDVIPVSPDTAAAYTVDLPANVQLYDTAFKPLVKVSGAATVKAGPLTGTGYIGVVVTTGGKLQLAFAKVNAVTVHPVTAPPAPPVPATYPVTVGGKPVGDVVLP